MKTILIALLIMGFSKVNEYPKPEKHWKKLSHAKIYGSEENNQWDSVGLKIEYVDAKSFVTNQDSLFFICHTFSCGKYDGKYNRRILLSSRSILSANNIAIPAAESDNYDKILAIYKQMLKEKKKGRKP